jgi:hypothetical protein
MSAIITSKFRLDTTEKFVDSLASNTFYMGLGRSNAWTDDTTPDNPYENDYTTNTLWENMFAMKKCESVDIIYSSPRTLWVSGVSYAEYDDRDINLEGKNYFVVSDNNNVFMCLKSGGVSTTNPDIAGVTTAGVIDHASTDGYIWKYMYTIPVDTGSKFLTASFIPVQYITAAPAPGADTALINQWSVQDNAIDGAIYNIKIVSGGTGYTSAPTVTVSGNGTGATATAIVTGGIITDIDMTAVGTGYTKAVITVTGGAGSGGSLRPVIGPTGGFGKDPRNDLRSHYVTINKVFNGDENGDIPATNDFRQIALIRNPIDAATSTTAANNAYTTTKSLSVATGGSFAADAMIEGTSTSAKAMVIEYDATNGIIYFIQNEDTGFVNFTDDDNIRVVGDTGGGVDCTAVNVAGITQYSGDVMFLENRTSVSRGVDQIETIRLVIAF